MVVYLYLAIFSGSYLGDQLHPFRKIKKYFQAARQRKLEKAQAEQIDREVEEFITEVDTRVRVFELNPELPEILELKRDARELRVGPMGDGMLRLCLMWLNPYREVTKVSDHVTVHERWFGHVLQSWSLIEFHLERYEITAIDRIRVDEHGTRVYAGRSEVACYEAGVLRPGRLADPGNRVENATALVEHFTGIALDWPTIHKFHWIKDDEGSWNVVYDPEPAYT
jgi:hypothetical protein